MSLVCLSSVNCLRAFFALSLEEAFFLGRQPCRPIWCSVLHGLSTDRLTSHPFNLCSNAGSTHMSISQTSLWIWRWARALNFFGQPWRGLFWVKPVLLNRCMVLATMLQLSFRVLAIFYSLRHIYSIQFKIICTVLFTTIVAKQLHRKLISKIDLYCRNSM